MTKITNNSKAPQGINVGKRRIFVRPGQTKDLELSEFELEQVQRLKFLSIDGSNPVEEEEKKEEAPQLKGRAEGATSVTIPSDWKELDWPQRRSLASSLTDDPVKTSDDANRVIEAEIAERMK